MRFATIPVLLLASALSAGAAQIRVAGEPEFRLSSFQTWTWGEGAREPRPEVQRWIEDAVERHLADRGLVYVDAAAEIEVLGFAGLQPGTGSDFWPRKTGPLRLDPAEVEGGALVLLIRHRGSTEVIWGGLASLEAGPLVPAPKIRRRIERALARIFSKMPGKTLR